MHAGLHPNWTDLHAIAARTNEAQHDDDWLRSDDVRYAIRVRCCAPSGKLSKYTGPPADCPPPARPWDDFYGGETLVVHGHWAQRGYYRGKRTMGLDSGCVYGGPLTAWCQEEDRIVEVTGVSSANTWVRRRRVARAGARQPGRRGGWRSRRSCSKKTDTGR